MFSKLSESISGGMLKNGILQPDKLELCRYGIQQFFTMLLNMAITLAIGVLMGMVIESVLFIVAYIPLRSYAGGYHAKTPKRCCVFSAFLVAIVLSAMKFAFMPFYVIISAWFAAGVILFLFAPVEDKNKPLDEIEVKVYKKRALIIWGVEVALGVVFLVFELRQFAAYTAWVMLVACLMVVLGKAKNFRKSKTVEM